MVFKNNGISIRQFQILIILNAFGTGVVVLPGRAAGFAGQDGWLIVVFLAVIGVFLAWILATVGQRMQSESFLSYSGRLLTKPVAFILGAVFLVKLLINACLSLRLFAEMLRTVLLPKTPISVTCAVFLIVSAYAASKGVEARARIGEMLFYIMIVPLLLMIALAFFSFDFSNLQPALSAAPDDLFAGTIRLGFVFTGLEYILLAYPCLKRAQNSRGAVCLAAAFAGVLVVLLTLATLAAFGPLNIHAQPWPMMKMMDMAKIPFTFLERQSALMMGFWILAAFMSINAALYYGVLLLRDMTVSIRPHGRNKYILLCIMPFVYVLSLLPCSVFDVLHYMDFLAITFGAACLVAIPLLLLAVGYVRPKPKMDDTGKTPLKEPRRNTHA